MHAISAAARPGSSGGGVGALAPLTTYCYSSCYVQRQVAEEEWERSLPSTGDKVMIPSLSSTRHWREGQVRRTDPFTPGPSHLTPSPRLDAG